MEIRYIYENDITVTKREVIWSESFPIIADQLPATEYSVGKLKGSNCIYTLDNLDSQSFTPGQEYSLIIYSRSFKTFSTPSMDGTEYLFGDLPPNLPVYEYNFKYIDYFSTSGTLSSKLYPEQRYVDIKASYPKLRVMYDLNSEGERIVRELVPFGVIVKFSVDGGGEGCESIKGGYIIQNTTEEIEELCIRNLDLGECRKGELQREMHTIRVYIDSLITGDSSRVINSGFMFYSGEKVESIGDIACENTCKTCSGVSEGECTSCFWDSKYNYLYKGMCVEKCPDDQPYNQISFEPNSYVFSHYECMSTCRPKYFAGPAPYHACSPCNSHCALCSSDLASFCSLCTPTLLKQIPPGEPNERAYLYEQEILYLEKYTYKGMCLDACPPTTLTTFVPIDIDQGDGGDKELVDLMVLTELHECKLSTNQSTTPPTTFPSLTSHPPLTVWIQDLAYPDKLSIKKEIRLRAMIEDDLQSLDSILWSIFPPEVYSDESEQESEEKRIFMSYMNKALNKQIINLNMNGFNYKPPDYPCWIKVTVRNKDSYSAFDMIEVYASRSPNMPNFSTDTATPEFNYSTNVNSTEWFTVKLKAVEDVDDFRPIIRLKARLKVKALSSGGSPNNNRYRMLSDIVDSQLPQDLKNLYSFKHEETDSTDYMSISIRIPPIIQGPQRKKSGVIADTVKGDLYISAMDRHYSISEIKSSIYVKEQYTPGNRIRWLRTLALNESYENIDNILFIANSLDVITSELAYTPTSRDICVTDRHCGGPHQGYCWTGNPRYSSKCICLGEFEGVHCSWRVGELPLLHNITSRVILYLGDYLTLEGTHSTLHLDIITNTIQALRSLLKNPEALPYVFLQNSLDIVQNIIELLDLKLGLRMERQEKEQFLDTIYRVFVSLLFWDKLHNQEKLEFEGNFIPKYQRREDGMRINGSKLSVDEYTANNTQYINKLSENVMQLRDALYTFLNLISHAQYPDIDAFFWKTKLFEVLLVSEYEETLFGGAANNINSEMLTLQIPGSQGYVYIPRTFCDNLRNIIGGKLEFKFRLVKWIDTPYIYASSSKYIASEIINFMVLDSFGRELNFMPNNTATPFYISIPISHNSKGLIEQNSCLKCKMFNKERKVELLGREERLVEHIYKTGEYLVPDFEATENVGMYPEAQKNVTYDSFGCVTALVGEFAAVHLARAQSLNTINIPKGIYMTYDPMNVL